MHRKIAAFILLIWLSGTGTALAAGPSPAFVLWVKALATINEAIDKGADGADIALDELMVVGQDALEQLTTRLNRVRAHQVEPRPTAFKLPPEQVFAEDPEVRAALRARVAEAGEANRLELARLEKKRADLAAQRARYQHLADRAHALAKGLLSLCQVSGAFSRDACYGYLDMSEEIAPLVQQIVSEYHRAIREYKEAIATQQGAIKDVEVSLGNLETIEETFEAIEASQQVIQKQREDLPGSEKSDDGRPAEPVGDELSVRALKGRIGSISERARTRVESRSFHAHERGRQANARGRRNAQDGARAMRPGPTGPGTAGTGGGAGGSSPGNDFDAHIEISP